MSSEPTLIRGADGALYYLPPGELDSYRVPEDLAGEVSGKVEEAMAGAGADDAEVAGFNFGSFRTDLTVSRLDLDGLNPVAPVMDSDKTVIINW